MAKQNNSLTELQALEGIYEHLSTVDDLAKEVGAISTRLRKIEERLKEPMEITDPILTQDLTRDTCIYGALAKSMEACRDVKEQKIKINDIITEQKHIRSLLDNISKGQSKQNSAFEALITMAKEGTKGIDFNFKLIVMMSILIFVVITINFLTM
jgi:predicted ATP-grasp superfamily ATP-dependent carboligase